MRWLVALCIVSCAPEHATTSVEITPLPTVSATATAAVAAPVATGTSMQGGAVDARDPRRIMARSPALVQTELRALEQLLTATSASSPDRPALLRRLAEDYVEERKAGVAGASVKAIHHYDALAKTYPTYPQIDEVRYFLGLEYELSGDLSNARRTFYSLIRDTPNSKYVPYAYFAFGEMFFQETKGDPTKFQLAEQAYMEVLKFSASPIVPEAMARLSEVYAAQGNTAQAESMKQRLLRDHPSSEAAQRMGAP